MKNKKNRFEWIIFIGILLFAFVNIDSVSACGENVSYEGEDYPTVQIGDQCWFAKNINIGIRINGSNNQTDNSTTEKYCYDDNEANCTIYGGLYQWDEAMQYTETAGVQGICPTDWHIPTDVEQHTLESFLATGTCDPNRSAWGCDPAGGSLKEAGTSHWNTPNTGATNSSGFTALPAGYRRDVGIFTNLNTVTWFWSSSISGTNAWRRSLGLMEATVFRGASDQANGFSVRCLNDGIVASYTLTYNSDSNGSITGITPQTIDHGDDGLAVTATPNTNYHFVDWSDSSTDNPRTDTNITGDITVTANFVEDYVNSSSWLSRLPGAINHNNVSGNSNLTNFPILISNQVFTEDIFNNTQSNGEDLRFTLDEAGTQPLAFEIVSWDTSSETGEVWVNLPTVSHDSDTAFYVWYNNTSASALSADDLYGSQNVWDDNYKHVSHDGGITDSTSNSDNGVGYNRSEPDGKIGSEASELSGSSSSYIDIDSVVMTGYSNSTIQTWLALDDWSPVANNIIFSARYNNVWDDIRFNYEWLTSFVINYDDGVEDAVISPTTNFTEGSWHYLTATQTNSGSGRVDNYLDGASFGSPDTSANFDYSGLAGEKYIGKRFNDSVPLDGKIDEFRISDIARSADWISTEYNNQNSIYSFVSINNRVPDSPTLSQLKDDESTIISNGELTEENNIKLSASVIDPDEPETLSLFFEVQENSSSFSSPEVPSVGLATCSSGTELSSCANNIWSVTSSMGDYSSSSYDVIMDIQGLSEEGSYKWQVNVCDDSDICTGWNSFNETTPNFIMDSIFDLTYNSGSNGSILGATSQVVNYGDNGTEVTAVPNTNYHFVDWSDSSTDNPRTDTNIIGDITVTANFVLDTSYTLLYNSDSNGSITGTTSQTIDHGDDGLAVTATPNTNYHFVDWSDSSTDNPRTDTNITGDITVIANFAIDSYTVVFQDHDTTELKTETVGHGSNAIAPIDPTRAGYTFTGWDVEFSNIISNLTVTADYSVNPEEPIENPVEDVIEEEQEEECDSTIGNTIWLDINPNGFQEINEPGLENIRVKLLDHKKRVIERTDTNHNGHYKFENLCKGKYKVVVKEEDIPIFIYKQTYDSTGSIMNNKATVYLEEDRNDNHTKADFGFAFNLPL